MSKQEDELRRKVEEWWLKQSAPLHEPDPDDEDGALDFVVRLSRITRGYAFTVYAILGEDGAGHPLEKRIATGQVWLDGRIFEND